MCRKSKEMLYPDIRFLEKINVGMKSVESAAHQAAWSTW